MEWPDERWPGTPVSRTFRSWWAGTPRENGTRTPSRGSRRRSNAQRSTGPLTWCSPVSCRGALRPRARLEYRLALEQAPELEGLVFGESTRLVAGYYDAMELTPTGKSSLPMLHALVEALADRLPATCSRLDAEIAVRAPTDPMPAIHAAQETRRGYRRLGPAAPWCWGPAHDACVAIALDAAARAERLAPATCEPYLLRARTWIADGKAARGLSELADAADSVKERVQCLEALATLADEAHDEQRASRAIAKIAADGCSDDRECAGNFAWIAGIEEHKGNSPASAGSVQEQRLRAIAGRRTFLRGNGKARGVLRSSRGGSLR